MSDFWIACGHHLLDRDESGGLCVTDEFLKAYFVRPELMPPKDACPVERRLHREMLADPRRVVVADEVAAILKTHHWRADALIARIAQLHSYDTPCIVNWPIDKILGSYADWVEDSVIRDPSSFA